MNHAFGTGSIVWPVDQQSSTLPLCYGCPIGIIIVFWVICVALFVTKYNTCNVSLGLIQCDNFTVLCIKYALVIPVSLPHFVYEYIVWILRCYHSAFDYQWATYSVMSNCKWNILHVINLVAKREQCYFRIIYRPKYYGIYIYMVL